MLKHQDHSDWITVVGKGTIVLNYEMRYFECVTSITTSLGIQEILVNTPYKFQIVRGLALMAEWFKVLTVTAHCLSSLPGFEYGRSVWESCQ